MYILSGPGIVNDLRTFPDIASIMVTWQRPSENVGGAFVTGYEVTHQLFVPEANPIRQTYVNGSANTSHIVSNLLPRQAYQIIVRALVAGIGGEPLQVIRSTLEIGGA